MCIQSVAVDVVTDQFALLLYVNDQVEPVILFDLLIFVGVVQTPNTTHV